MLPKLIRNNFFLTASSFFIIFIIFLISISIFYYKVDEQFLKNKFYNYSQILLPDEYEYVFLQEVHEIGFLDEYYSVKIKCNQKFIDHILSIKPNWAIWKNWKKGEKKFFKDNIEEFGDQYYMIYGYEGATIFRTIVIDKSKNILEFEYITV